MRLVLGPPASHILTAVSLPEHFMITRGFDGLPAAEPRSTPLDGRPVLLIDDRADGRRDTAAMLIVGGHAVLAEADGDAALHAARTHALGCVVSELYIPCSEGRCVVMALKADRDRLPSLRVLVYTHHGSDADLAWALAAGCDALLSKPAPADVLLREVRRLEELREHERPRREVAPP